MTRSTFYKNDKKALLRKKIDAVDTRLVALLEERLMLVSQLKDLKKTLTDKKREKEILSRTHSPFVQDIYKTIFRNSKKMLKTLL